MFDDKSLREIGIEPQLCRARAKLYSSRAARELERSRMSKDTRTEDVTDDPVKSHELSGIMQKAQVGFLLHVSAECSSLINSVDAYTAISDSGRSYLATGVPYGLLLTVLFPRFGEKEAGERYSWNEFYEFMNPAPTGEDQADLPSDRNEMLHAALRRPEQILWLFLAAANSNNGRGLIGDMWQQLELLNSHGHLHVGPLGIPIASHLPLFDAIKDEAKPAENLTEVFALAIARRVQMLETARRNEYLWHRCRSPISLFDFHLYAFARAAELHGHLERNDVRNIQRVIGKENPLIELAVAPISRAFNPWQQTLYL